jgi:hypothetical protein
MARAASSGPGMASCPSSGDHRVRHEFDVLADAQEAEQDLEQAAEGNDGEGEGGPVPGSVGKHGGVLGEDRRHDDGHGARRAGYLGRRAAAERGEEPHEDRAVQAGDRTRAGGHAHRHRQRQGHHRGGQATVDIAAQSVEVESVDQWHRGS